MERKCSRKTSDCPTIRLRRLKQPASCIPKTARDIQRRHASNNALIPVRQWCLYDLHSSMSEGVKIQRRVPGEGRVSGQEAKSSEIRLAPSPGVQQSSNGIQGRAHGRSPRMYKEG